MIYKYKGYTKTGKTQKGDITARSIEEAKEILRNKNIYIDSLSEKRSFFKAKIPNAELITIARNLSIYLKSGIPLYQALSLLKNSYENNKKMTLWLDTLIENVRSGESFYDSLEEQTIYKLPNFFLYTVKVAEESSSLTQTLIELSHFMSTIERIKKEVTKALVYPAFIILVSFALINFMLTNIVPNIVSMFTSTGSQLPFATRLTLQLSQFLQSYGLALLFLLIATIALFIYFFAQGGRFRLIVDSFFLKIPLLKTILINYELGRFCNVSALLLNNGIPFAQTMNFSAKIFTNTLLRQIFENASKKIVEGSSFYDAIKSQKHFKLPADFMSAVAIGENSSELPSTLKTLAEFYEENNQDKISILLSLMEPVLMLFVGGVIGFLVISMLLPIFSLSIQ